MSTFMIMSKSKSTSGTRTEKRVRRNMGHGLRLTLLLLLITGHGSLVTSSTAQPPSLINYQGRLMEGTGLVNKVVSLELALYDAPTNGVVLYVDKDPEGVPVVDGLYSTYLGDHTVVGDLDQALTNREAWLEVVVEGLPLVPRERMASVAYARQVPGLLLTPENGIVLNPLAGTNVITASTNAAILGGRQNRIFQSHNAVIAGGDFNRIGTGATASAIGGGSDNLIASGTRRSVVAGGGLNQIFSNSLHSTIGGGYDNSIGSYVDGGTIVGGFRNNISRGGTGDVFVAPTILGGSDHSIGSQSDWAVVVGGDQGLLGTNSPFAVILGGNDNRVDDNCAYAFAAGRRARAYHPGAFVWGDTNNASLFSTNANSVTMRFSGGYRLFSNSGASIGAHLPPSASSWAALSDRNAKENFEPVDTAAILEKLAALPVTAWTYKDDPNHRRYIGPVAQDFHAAFGLGDDVTINTLDTDGVALAAIQALARGNHELRRMNDEMKRENEALRAEIAAIKARLGM